MRNKFSMLALAAFAAVWVAGCGSTPAAKLYTLTADAGDGQRVASERRKIEVISVRIPDLWDRPQVVLSKPSGEVSFSEFHRWATPLKLDMPRVVVRNLSRLLDNSTVWLREDFAGAQPDVRVQVTIEQLEAVAGSGLRLEASWMIRPAGEGAVHSGRAKLVEPLADAASYDAVVAAAGRAVLAMSTQIARDIAALPQAPAAKK